MNISFLSNPSHFSQWLENITQPGHPAHRYVQVCLFGCLTYTSAALLTSVPAKKASVVFLVAYSISIYMAPKFKEFFEPYKNISLVPLMGQFLLISSSVLSAKLICSVLGQTLTLKEIRIVGSACLFSLFITHLALRIFRQNVY